MGATSNIKETNISLQLEDDNLTIYYQQDCSKQETIELTFTYLDIVEKINAIGQHILKLGAVTIDKG
ncbi:9093_t:CDS:2 [Entrophospora sp. SA101]|nr:3950_t:CDS:2 [Entrophospora sp. SA101]CAJ0844948.1 9093_t:CDS:2 [Entrophospora sp. SA101]